MHVSIESKQYLLYTGKIICRAADNYILCITYYVNNTVFSSGHSNVSTI